MINEIDRTSKFKKDLKTYKHNKDILNELDILLKLLTSGSEIPEKYKKHQLKGQYLGEYDYHIRPNVVLICHTEDNVLILSRIGTHNKLGLTEDISSYL